MIVISAVLFCLFFLFFNNESTLSNERIQELREIYPAFNQSPPLIEQRELAFEEVIHLSETYIIGEIIKPLPRYEVVLSGAPDSPERKINEKLEQNGVKSNSIEYVQYEIKVLETIAGEPVNDTIILTYSSENIGYFPSSFEPRMRLILPLGQESGQKKGKYGTTKYGLYYIVDDHYALSVVENNSTMAYNGNMVDEVVKTIRELKARA